MATKPRVGGAKGLNGRATKKIIFFGGFPTIFETNNNIHRTHNASSCFQIEIRARAS